MRSTPNAACCPWSGSVRTTSSTARTARPACSTCSPAAASSSSTTSCSTPNWQDACSSCIADVEELGAGLHRHLHARVTTLVHVSRAALPTIEAYQARRGWSIPWYSSYGSDFNYDFGVTLDDSVTPAVYNYRTRAEHQQAGTGYYLAGEQPVEVPGLSCFLRDGDAVFHTYSTYGRGDEMTGGAYYYLDLTALGRQEDWEQPHGRADHARRGVPDFAE